MGTVNFPILDWQFIQYDYNFISCKIQHHSIILCCQESVSCCLFTPRGNRKLILVFIQERTLLSVSGRIESSDFSLSLSSCSFSLFSSSFSFLSLLLVLLPSFLPSFRCITFVGQMHSEQNQPIQLLPCVFVLS